MHLHCLVCTIDNSQLSSSAEGLLNGSIGVVRVAVSMDGLLFLEKETPQPLARLASLARAVVPATVGCGVVEPELPSTLGIAMLER